MYPEPGRSGPKGSFNDKGLATGPDLKATEEALSAARRARYYLLRASSLLTSTERTPEASRILSQELHERAENLSEEVIRPMQRRVYGKKGLRRPTPEIVAREKARMAALSRARFT